ncbi:MAG: putative Ig domain-containing protein, partial [Acidimicrobiia bacterium]|nr:putative Ig domain-containing protein [Acidimicrobiia bacterium]
MHERRRAAARPLHRLALVLTSFFLSAVTVVPWVIPESQALDPVVFKAVQSGTATLAPGSTVATVPIAAVDPAKAFLVFGLEENLGRPGDGAVSGRLVDATSLRFERAEGGGTVSIRWQVAEFTSGVRVQRGSHVLGSTPAFIAIGAVDQARSFVLTSSQCSGDFWADNDFVRSRIISGTSLELATTAIDSSPTVEWQVVEYAEATVQHGTVSLGAGQAAATVPVAAVSTQHAWLITSYQAATSADPPIGERLVRGRVTSASTLVFDRWVTSGSVDIAWSLVEFQDGTEVRHGSERFSSGEAQRDVTITAVEAARSIGTAGYQTTGGSSPYNSDDVPGVAFFTSRLVDGSTLRLRRGSTIDPADVGWFVVYWRGHPPAFEQDLTDRTHAEGDAVSLPSPATDPDGDPLAYSATGLPPGLVVNAATGTISGTISYDAGAGSPYAVVLRVADPRGLFATDSFTWTITNTNRAPVVTSPGDRTDGEGTVISLLVTGSDPDGDLLAWSATDLPPGLDIDPATGLISGTVLPTAVLGSPYAVEVRADDPAGLFATASFTWTVTGAGLPGGGNTYLVAGTGGAAGGDDLLTVADRGDTNPATNEANVGSGTGTFNLFGLDQSPANGLLYGSNGDRLGLVSMVTGIFTPLGGTFGSGSGPAGAITFNAVHGIAFDPASGNLYAVHNVVGDRDVLFRVDAATGLRVPGAFGGDDYLVIDPSHDKKKETYDIAFDPTTGLLWALGADHPADGPERVGTLNLTTGYLDLRSGKLDSLNPRGLSFDSAGNMWSIGSPGSGGRLFLIDKVTGKPGFAITVDNGGAYQAIEIIYLRPPVFSLDLVDRSDPEGAVISLAAPASDPDGDPLAWSATGLPPGLSIAPATGLISGTITYDAFPGSPYAVVVRVEDPGGLFDTDSFTWTVTEANRPPTFDGDLVDRTDAEGQTISLAAPASDLDGDLLAWSAAGLPPGLSIAPATGLISGTITYDAAPGSPYAVVVRVEDPGGLFDSDSFTWTVTNTNRPPVFDDPLLDRADGEGSSVLLPTPASDPDGDGLTWSATGLPPGLMIDPAAGTISGTIATGASAGSPYAVQVRVED